MSIRPIRAPMIATACLTLAACSSSSKLGDLWSTKSDGATSVAATGGGETTGSVAQAAAPAAPSAKAGIRVGNSGDDLQRGKTYFASKNYELAAASFRSAADKHPGDAKTWIGLATSYDQLHRFDLADRAYDEAIRLVGATAEILNDQAHSYMLRGDYARAQKMR